MTDKKVKVKGPAKVFYSNSSFKEEKSENRTIGDLVIKNNYGSRLSRIRMSSQKRSTLVGGSG